MGYKKKKAPLSVAGPLHFALFLFLVAGILEKGFQRTVKEQPDQDKGDQYVNRPSPREAKRGGGIIDPEKDQENHRAN
ncbi:MAG: hypothetical protein WCX27_02905 [Candidatus Paceibacterota bacterium]|jgi:hypothetical protein